MHAQYSCKVCLLVLIGQSQYREAPLLVGVLLLYSRPLLEIAMHIPGIERHSAQFYTKIKTFQLDT
jgi:hypothetical protein